MRTPVRNRKILLVVLVAGAAMASLVGVFRALQEPTYQGRRLSEWLPDFSHDQTERRLLAAEAIKHMGSNAVPFLVTSLEHSRPGPAPVSPWWLRLREWVNKKLSIKSAAIRPQQLRGQTLAALDALGPEAKPALPALEVLLEENPPDPDALYVIARIGEGGVPILERMLTNSTSSEAKLLRLEARCCLGMMASNSPVLHPPASDPDAQGYSLRICEFHLIVMGAAFREYQAEHPEGLQLHPLEP